MLFLVKISQSKSLVKMKKNIFSLEVWERGEKGWRGAHYGNPLTNSVYKFEVSLEHHHGEVLKHFPKMACNYILKSIGDMV